MPLLPRHFLGVLGISVFISSGAASGQGRKASTKTMPCDNAASGITVPAGFCAVIVADHVGPARHLAIAPNGDVFVALANSREKKGGVLALRDTTGDGAADVKAQFGENGGNGITLVGQTLYFAPNDAVLRYNLPSGSLQPPGGPDTVVMGLPAQGGHVAKSVAVNRDGYLFVNIGSRTNTCQEQDRTPGSPGISPCVERDTRAGIWQFYTTRLHQRPQDGQHYATGLRNVVALTVDPTTGGVYGLQHGRDQLFDNWPKLFTPEYNAENPGEEFVQIRSGDDYGWPYCFYATDQKRLVLAPEYGGDGTKVELCAQKKTPIVAFPGHWAPDGVAFYRGSQFPAKYRGGAFIAFHGSWNRAPLPQAGYKVVFLPLSGDGARVPETFADGFAGADVQPGTAAHRPTGVAVGPDGSLYIADDAGGRIWRIFYRGQ
jgi:glucose/arabinose dehydrogenase